MDVNPLYRYDYNIFLLEKQDVENKKNPQGFHQGDSMASKGD